LLKKALLDFKLHIEVREYLWAVKSHIGFIQQARACARSLKGLFIRRIVLGNRISELVSYFPQLLLVDFVHVQSLPFQEKLVIRTGHPSHVRSPE
jgi:hypothetical protein